MKKWTFLVLVMIVGWLGLIIWSFFWWSSDKTQITEWQIPQSSDTWFVNNLTNTGDIQEAAPTIATEQKNNPQKDYTEIKLMMPKYFYTPAR